MSDDTPKIDDFETSPELSEFPSEADFPSASASSSGTASALSLGTFPREDAPARETSRSAPVPFILPASGDQASAVVPEPDGVEAAPPVNAHIGPATITEFPVRSHTPAAVALPTLEPGPVTLVELIERHGGFDWREAVAVIHQICLYLREHSTQAPILLDPRHIQITEKGEVLLLAGQPSSDPLVIQVGRLMRTMLMGKDSPPELRLLLAQATFELPIFQSIEDVDRALAQLSRLDEPGPAGLALLRAVAAPPPVLDPADDQGYRPPPIRSIFPAEREARRRARARAVPRALVLGYGSHLAVIFAAIAAIAILLMTRPALLFPDDPPPAMTVATVGTSSPPLIEVPSATPGASGVAISGSASSASAGSPSALGTGPGIPTPPIRQEPAAVTAGRPGGDSSIDPRSTRFDPARRVPRATRPQATVGVALPLPPSPRESERRAASLLERGQTEAAHVAFRSLVRSNPLYEPRPSDLTPEGLEAFRTIQREVLPDIAQRTYDRAWAAFSGGDSDRALALARHALTILDRHLAEAPAHLRDQVQGLIDQAATVVAALDEIVYTEADEDVVPPRQLTRQMPLTGPIGVPPHRVGWLDILIGRDGTVENIKLHTPMNRHHERMIVSPAKAWRYRPATKGGRPVRYRILVKVNLPESGT